MTGFFVFWKNQCEAFFQFIPVYPNAVAAYGKAHLIRISKYFIDSGYQSEVPVNFKGMEKRFFQGAHASFNDKYSIKK